MNNIKKALEYAIKCLKEYGTDDEYAGMEGYGCYTMPDEKINAWIKEIRRIENGKNK